jgi:hypothetical protein
MSINSFTPLDRRMSSPRSKSACILKESSTAIFPHAILQNIKRPRYTESGICDILQQARYEYHSFEVPVYEILTTLILSHYI